MRTGRPRLGLSSVAVLSVAVLVSMLAVVASGNSKAVAHLLDGGAWLANSSAGSVTHASAAGADATVTLPKSLRGNLQVVQNGGDVYVQDGKGHVARIDQAQLSVSKQTTLPAAVQVVTGGGRLYGVDDRAGTVQSLDPVSLKPLAAPVHLGGPLGSAVVDPSGNLWVPLTSKGSVAEVTGSTPPPTSPRPLAPRGQTIELSTVNNDVVGLDPGTSTLFQLSGAGRGRHQHVPLGANTSWLNPTQVQGAPVLPVLNPQRHQLATVDVGGSGQLQVDLGHSGDQLGSPQINSPFIYVPDYSDGSLLVVQSATGRQLAPITVTGRPSRFTTLINDGEVFVNDPATNKAWVVDGSGGVTPINKYNPDAPSRQPTLATSIPPQPPDQSRSPSTVPPNNSFSGGGFAPSSGGSPGGPVGRPVRGSSGRIGGGRIPGGRTIPPPPASMPIVVSTPSSAGDGGPSPAPGDVVASAGNGSASVSWTAPTAKQPVDGYEVTVNPTKTVERLAAGQTSFDATGLTNGQPYTFSVAALTKSGPGPSVTSNVVTPEASVASAPGDVTATGGDALANVSWTAPDLGGGTLTGYVVEAVPEGADPTPIVKPVPPSSTSVTVSGLVDGTAYVFQVAAQESDGTTSKGGISNPVTPVGPPAAPTGVTATPSGSGQVTVSWTAPSDSGSAITAYSVTSPQHAPVPVAAGSTSTVIGGLTNGAAYSFSVAATNAVGTGPAAQASPATPQSGVPDAPGGVTATPGDGTATVSWSAPASLNGTTVASYTVQVFPAGAGAPSQSLPTTGTSEPVSGLTDGTSYTFDVIAVGADGASSPASAPSAAVTPVGPPGAFSVSATGDLFVIIGELTVKWTPPADNGSAITGYTITMQDEPPVTVDPTATSAHVPYNLSRKTLPTFTVTATNAVGSTTESGTAQEAPNG